MYNSNKCKLLPETRNEPNLRPAFGLLRFPGLVYHKLLESVCLEHSVPSLPFFPGSVPSLTTEVFIVVLS